MTRGMSLKGGQTGNTSRCCQYVFMCLWKCACEYIYSKLLKMYSFIGVKVTTESTLLRISTLKKKNDFLVEIHYTMHLI